MKSIASVQNPLVKHLLQLQEKSKLRRQTGSFLIEGRREMELALKGGYTFDTVLIQSDRILDVDLNAFGNAELVEVSREVYQKLAYREATEGIIGVARSKSHELSDLVLGENPLILIAQSPEKPGNVGALLRTADAANLDAVIFTDSASDLYNPNIVRSSVGCLFTCQIATATTAEALAYLQSKNIAVYAATLQDSVSYHTQDFTQPTALVVGTEATGLTPEWREAAAQNILIPMQGAIDSMNVSVAAAVLIFEAKRQRGFV